MRQRAIAPRIGRAVEIQGEIDRKKRLLKIFAIGHRREVYQELAEQLHRLRQRRK